MNKINHPRSLHQICPWKNSKYKNTFPNIISTTDNTCTCTREKNAHKQEIAVSKYRYIINDWITLINIHNSDSQDIMLSMIFDFGTKLRQPLR